MIGSIAGDVIGSIFEHNPTKSRDFSLLTTESTYTDDTVLTVAIAEAILTRQPYEKTMKHFGRQFPYAGYGMSFFQWLQAEESEPYFSWGNGSAMRVSPVGFAFDNMDRVLAEAKKSATVTHNHPEGIKGAQATALSIYLARTGSSKERIRNVIQNRFGYNLSRTLDAIRPSYSFDVSCQGSVPESIIAFLESESVEDAIRNAISLGGDSDTMACIAGGIAQAFYGKLPEDLERQVRMRLPDMFLDVIDRFSERFDW
mgnify:CR=1 FL=1